jgi:hypothetical protein
MEWHQPMIRVGALATVSVLAACGPHPGPAVDGGDSASAAQTSRVTPEAVREAFKTIAYDYDPVSVDELASRAEVVVSGTVLEVVDGRIDGAQDMSDPFAGRNAAVLVEVDTVREGARTGDRLWIEIDLEPDRLRPVLPPGTEIAVFLVTAPESKKDYPYGGEGSQIPEGVRLWSVTHAQGLVIQYGAEQGTVAPFTEDVNPNATAADALRAS